MLYTRYVGSNVPRSASRRALAFLHERFLAEQPHALLHRHIFRMQPDADDEAGEADEGLGELTELDAVLAPAEPGLDHHLLAVVRPAFDEGRRREHDRLARLGFDAPQVLIVQEVARIDLVNRDRPQRREVVVAQVLFLAIEASTAGSTSVR